MGKTARRIGGAHAAGHALTAVLLAAFLAGCSVDSLVGDAPLPSNVNDPAATETPEGALSAYRGTIFLFAQAFGGVSAGFAPTTFIPAAGLLSDELQDGSFIGQLPGAFTITGLDVRLLPEQTDPNVELNTGTPTVFGALQKVRGQAQQALGLLQDFPPKDSPALQAHVYALDGYSEVLLADLYCSGIPLSTLDYKGDYTLRPGSSTAEVYQHALALFDAALALPDDSTRFVGLAQIGKGRALVALGRFAEAAAAVQGIPDGFSYVVRYGPGSQPVDQNFAQAPSSGLPWQFSVSDLEGGTGLDFRSSGDPRTSATGVGPNLLGQELFHPDKYAPDGNTPIVLADWIEARLIEAEAALNAGDIGGWLGKLNALRASQVFPPAPDDPTNTPRTLAPLDDPGLDGRVALMFRERAFWLFLTGHRQGDLRRLIRQYGRSPDQVYPIGLYPGNAAVYGADVTAPIPAAERASNPNFTGCLSRGA
jgi:hypothetical protein